MPNGVRYPSQAVLALTKKEIMDNHQHTSFTDGRLTIQEAMSEAFNNYLYEKGAIEHGNPLDPDINHQTTFMPEELGGNSNYTDTEVVVQKYDAIKNISEDHPGVKPINDAELNKILEDISYFNDNSLEESDLEEIGLNYRMVVPHGIELDYNPVIESLENPEEGIESYEENMIDFLKNIESLNAGFNFVLLSSHYVNTPYEPKYVKVDEQFEEMSHGEKGDVLEAYRDKEIAKIESMASKLSEMKVPELSGELMTPEEMDELQEFVYDQDQLIESITGEEISGKQNSVGEISLERPGPLVVGAHPTLIERNEELMDYFRKEEGLTTKEQIQQDLNQRMTEEITKQEVDQFLGEKATNHLYPKEKLKNYYEPMIEAAENQENFIFEINGKGIERQHPSIFWQMLNEYTFGSDSHRPNEQHSRTQDLQKADIPAEPVLLTEKWLEKQNWIKKPVKSGKINLDTKASQDSQTNTLELH